MSTFRMMLFVVPMVALTVLGREKITLDTYWNRKPAVNKASAAQVQPEMSREEFLQRQRAASVSSNLLLPQFGRRKTLYGIVSSDAPYPRSVIERLRDYFNPCVKRQPLNAVSEAAMKLWRQKNIQCGNLDEFARGKTDIYIRRFRLLVALLADVAAECFRYNIPQNVKKPCELINSYFADGHVWRKVALGSASEIATMNANFRVIEDHLNERLDILDRIHMAEYAAWKSSNREEFEKLSTQLASEVERQKTTDTMREMQAALARSKQEVESAHRRAAAAEASAAAASAAAASSAAAAQRAAADANYYRQQLDFYGVLY